MNTSNHINYPVIPQGNFKCVWMSAGILSYQLCDRLYECDACPLDMAMRNHFVDNSPKVHLSIPTARPNELHDDRLYSNHHCWIQELSHNRFRVGLEPTFAYALPIPKAVVLPSVGQTFKKDKASVWMIYEEKTFPVYSPIDGVVVARNASLNEHPREAIEHPFGEGWLFEIEIQQGSKLPETLMHSVEATRFYKNHSDRFKDLVVTAVHRPGTFTGATLADGGQPVRQISEMLGQKRYLQLLMEVYGDH